jgi:Na+/H+ antiporter NhaD/arsenite permease-like protein
VAIAVLLVLAGGTVPAVAASSAPTIDVAGVPVDFIVFALTLAGIAFFHHHTLGIALAGLSTVTVLKVGVTGFVEGPGLGGLIAHIGHEWVMLANLFLLLMGFALLSRHFELSRVPDEMPAVLPDNWTGGFVLLVIVFVLSSFIDNIAAALIGGTIARHVFRGRVHIGYLAGIVAASNAGGSGSVVGDTTTTMMWIDGVSPLSVLDAYVAAGLALVVCGIPAALQQQAYAPIVKHAPSGLKIDIVRVGVVLAILATAVVVNVLANVRFPAVLANVPPNRTQHPSGRPILGVPGPGLRHRGGVPNLACHTGKTDW